MQTTQHLPISLPYHGFNSATTASQWDLKTSRSDQFFSSRLLKRPIDLSILLQIRRNILISHIPRSAIASSSHQPSSVRDRVPSARSLSPTVNSFRSSSRPLQLVSYLSLCSENSIPRARLLLSYYLLVSPHFPSQVYWH